MLFETWYTDTVDVYRTVTGKTGSISRETREKVNSRPIRCRVYSTQISGGNPQNTAAVDRKEDKLACPVGTDIQTDDELIVTRGGGLYGTTTERYIAGKPQTFYDPVGYAKTGIAHMEIGLLADNRVR
jgi:hypothetical protein